MNGIEKLLGSLEAKVDNLHEQYTDGKKNARRSADLNARDHKQMLEILGKTPSRKETWKIAVFVFLVLSALGISGKEAIAFILKGI